MAGKRGLVVGGEVECVLLTVEIRGLEVKVEGTPGIGVDVM